MSEVFGLTAIFPALDSSGNVIKECIVPPEGSLSAIPDVHPASEYLSSIVDMKKDNTRLCNYCEMHGCSDYCLLFEKNGKRKSKQEHKNDETCPCKCRYCRFGAGYEKNFGKGDTPGFECLEKPMISIEGNGLHRKKTFLCKRNTKRMNQVSLFLSQIWRGNVDIKPLLYFSHPIVPD